MKVPKGYTEATVLECIEKAVALLATSFTFGIYGVEDVAQEGRLMALEVLERERFNTSLPLAPFLFAHIRNRLINLKRNKFRRTDSPCLLCHRGNACGPDGQICDRYRDWKQRNQSKASLMCPGDLDNIPDEHEKRTHTDSTVISESAKNELVEMIDRKLPVELRASFLQMRAGVIIPKARRLQVEAAVKEIIGDALETE